MYYLHEANHSFFLCLGTLVNTWVLCIRAILNNKIINKNHKKCKRKKQLATNRLQKWDFMRAETRKQGIPLDDLRWELLCLTNDSQGHMNKHIYSITQHILSAYSVTSSILNALLIIFIMVQLQRRETTFCILIPKWLIIGR